MNDSGAALSNFTFTNGALRGTQLTLHASALVHRSAQALETIPLAAMTAVSVAFRRNERRLVWGIGLQRLQCPTILNLSGPVRLVTLSQGNSYSDIPNKQYGVYIQDDWRASSRLTLNLGLRYDIVTGLAIDQSLNPNFVKIQSAARAGLLDGIIVGCSFPDVTSATILTVTDASLLQRYFGRTALAWTSDQKRAVSGFAQAAAIDTLAPSAARIASSWRRSDTTRIRLAANPTIATANASKAIDVPSSALSRRSDTERWTTSSSDRIGIAGMRGSASRTMPRSDVASASGSSRVVRTAR